MMMRKSLLTAVMAITAITATYAQTANDDAVKVSWALTTGNLETGVCAPEAQSQFITPGAMTIGSGITITAESTSDKTGTTSDGYTQTFFKASKSGDNAITFSITPKEGITFTPTKVGLKAARWKTDKGSISVAWVNGDGSTTSLGSFTPKREASDPTCSIEEYTLDGSIASDKTCKLVVTISGMDGKKTISMGDVFVEGTTYGTVGQAITHNLTVVANPAEGGRVSVSPAGTTFERGSSVTLSQTPNDGWVFTGWYNNGALLSTSSSYTFNIMGNMDVEAKYQSEASLLVSDYIIVSNKDEFRAAIKQVNQNTTGKRQFIFMKNGDYDYGKFYNYPNDKKNYDPSVRDTIKADNVSLIGQKARHSGNNQYIAAGTPEEKGVLIHILPVKEGISTTSPIVNQGSGVYLQDFTIENDYKFSGTARGCCWQDEGNRTIGKNVCLLSYQDTYYAHKEDGQFYWETSDLRGVVDFICGNGDVFFNKCLLYIRDRQPYNATPFQGEATLSAPYTQVEDFNQPGGHGFIFMDCDVDCEATKWIFGRGWRGWPKEAFINTKLTETARLHLGTDQRYNAYDKKARVSLTSIQTTDDSHYMQFYEYNTMDENGQDITPETNVLTFKASDSGTYETVLKADEIDRFQLRNVYPDWQPDEDCRQVVVTSVTHVGNSLSWTTDTDAKAFLIEQDGDFVAIVDGTQSSTTVPDASPSGYTVRAANMMGGFGEPTTEGDTITGIGKVSVSVPASADAAIFSITGIRLSSPQRGINIVGGKKVIRK